MLHKSFLTSSILLTFLSFTIVSNAQQETIGHIERAHPYINKLIPPDTEIEVLAQGFEWSEGPVWVKEGGYLLFSDIPNNIVHKWSAVQGLEDYLHPSGYTGEIERGGETGSNGLAINAENNLVLCQHGDRRVAQMLAPLNDPQPEFKTLAATYNGKRFNSPNDLAFHSNGDIYFTDPMYGLEKRMDDPNKELDFQGVYRVDSDGEVTLLTDDLSRPNGIGFSPDEKTLYVANSDSRLPVWMAYPVKNDGTLGEGEILFDSGYIGRKGGGDGLKVDIHGNIFATGPGGVIILSPEGGYIGTIHTENATANCAFGNDGSTLYITADSYLLRVKTSTTGLGFE